MDSNNAPTPTNSIPAATPPAPEPTPATASTPVMPNVTQSSGGGSKKSMMIIIIVLILAILGAGGFYYYQMMSKDSGETAASPTPADNKDLDNLNTEVESIEVSDPDGAMMEIDTQIAGLDATASAKPASGSALLNSR
jgi:uncharacterized protein HemX